jgi:hypothetical protein
LHRSFVIDCFSLDDAIRRWKLPIERNIFYPKQERGKHDLLPAV